MEKNQGFNIELCENICRGLGGVSQRSPLQLFAVRFFQYNCQLSLINYETQNTFVEVVTH